MTKAQIRLRPCPHCNYTISETALICPGCGKSDSASVNIANMARRYAKNAALIGLAVAGPAALFGAIYGQEMNRPSAKQVRALAQSAGAIDAAPTGKDMMAFFARDGFFIKFLYELDMQSKDVELIDYKDVKRIQLIDWKPSHTMGMIVIEDDASKVLPGDEEAPRRPKPLERILLGKKLYGELVKAADDFDAGIRPEGPRGAGFWFDGNKAQERTKFFLNKFLEYCDVEVIVPDRNI